MLRFIVDVASDPSLNCESLPVQETSLNIPPGDPVEFLERVPPESAVLPSPDLGTALTKLSKPAIRTSLKASTLDGVFSTIFGCVTSGVLLTNFLLELGATSVEIGLLCAIPMLANFLQPIGAYFADKMGSRRRYNLWIFGLSRLLWVVLAASIGWACWHHTEGHQLVLWTVAIVIITNILSALGCASWLSWMAVLVPQRLRGRYFGLRNSAGSLTSLVCMPLLGLVVSGFAGKTIQGFGVVLFVGVVAGLISVGCQLWMADVNPLTLGDNAVETAETACAEPIQPSTLNRIFKDTNFLKFLLYLGLWTFAVNLSAPFFNIYLLKNLQIDVGWVTIYTSLTSGANLLMLMVWGKLADRFGNRPLLILVGILVALTPLLWLGAGNDWLSIWLWLPLVHVLGGVTWAAIDLCTNNIQMEIAPARQPSSYFAIAAAIAGVTGALGTTAGGFFSELSSMGGLGGLFALSAGLRLVAILPLIFVREPRTHSLVSLVRRWFPFKLQSVPVAATLIFAFARSAK